MYLEVSSNWDSIAGISKASWFQFASNTFPLHIIRRNNCVRSRKFIPDTLYCYQMPSNWCVVLFITAQLDDTKKTSLFDLHQLDRKFEKLILNSILMQLNILSSNESSTDLGNRSPNHMTWLFRFCKNYFSMMLAMENVQLWRPVCHR